MTDIPRSTAWAILNSFEKNPVRLDTLVSNKCRKSGLEGRDKAFVAEICYGVLRFKRALDSLVDLGVSRPGTKIKPLVRTTLRMGLYQALAMPEARHAAVNESVNLAKGNVKTAHAAGFVNAALRSVLGKLNSANLPEGLPISLIAERFLTDKRQSPAERLGTIYSFPNWLVERWLANFGQHEVERILESCQTKAPVYLRFNEDVYASTKAVDLLRTEGVYASPVGFVKGLLRVDQGSLPPESPLIQVGVVQPQDAASYLATLLLDVSQGDSVADVCCGKGIKTGVFARKAGHVACFDINPQGLITLNNKALAGGVGNVEAIQADMASPWPSRTLFDRIFIDAPCSATGLVRRRPESKWIKNEDLIYNLSGIQKSMLEQALGHLKPGGRLVYAVCSVEREEGSNIINSALGLNKDFRRVPVSSIIPELIDYQTDEGDMLILPGRDDMDGFFAAALERK